MEINITDKDGDDFIQGVVAVRVTRPDGVSRMWKLPRRLMNRSDVATIVVEEITAELSELNPR